MNTSATPETDALIETCHCGKPDCHIIAKYDLIALARKLERERDQLKQSLAKMLPEQLLWDEPFNRLHWVEDNRVLWPEVKDTELLHICWLIEKTLIPSHYRESVSRSICSNEWSRFVDELLNAIGKDDSLIHTTWKQRTIALAKVKGIEI